MSNTRQKLNPETVKRAKEWSEYAWAIWCETDGGGFHYLNSSIRIFGEKMYAETYLRNHGACPQCVIVQVKVTAVDEIKVNVVVDPSNDKFRAPKD